VLKRAKELTKKGTELKASRALAYFLNNDVTLENFDKTTLDTFAQLDDNDIISAMKEWQYHDDFVLRNLCEMLINRQLLKIKIKNKKIEKSQLVEHKQLLIEKYNITNAEADYFVFTGDIFNQAYQQKTQNINILLKSGKIEDIAQASDTLNIKPLSKPVTKYYICYPKDKM
jgi:HD superfamily phosphohydrolase